MAESVTSYQLSALPSMGLSIVRVKGFFFCHNHMFRYRESKKGYIFHVNVISTFQFPPSTRFFV